MTGRMWGRTGCVAAGTALSVGLLAAPAWAPKYIFGASAFGTCTIDGQADSHFQGSLTVLTFAAVDGQLGVTGTVVGTCADASANPVATVDQGPYDFSVESLTTECTRDNAGIEIRPGSGTVGGFVGDSKDAVKFTLDLTPSTVIDLTWRPGDPGALRGGLCALHNVVPHRDAAGVATALNTLLIG